MSPSLSNLLLDYPGDHSMLIKHIFELTLNLVQRVHTYCLVIGRIMCILLLIIAYTLSHMAASAC